MPEPGENESRDDFMERCIPMVLEDGTADDNEQAVAICNSMWEGKSTRVFVKSVNEKEAVVAGYGIVFGGKDLVGDTFTENTDFMWDLVPTKAVFYDHTLDADDDPLDEEIGFADNARAKIDKFGIWIEAQIDKSKEYAQAILELVDRGALGWSSGSVGHLVRRSNGIIKRWPIVEFSLTPTPAEPRTLGVERLKALFNAAGVALPEELAEGASQSSSVQAKGGVAETEIGENTVDELTVSDELIAKALEAFDSREAEKAAKVAEREALKAEIRAEVEAEIPAWKGGFVTKKVTELGLGNDEMKSFEYALRTGDMAAYKAAMQGQTDSEGGYAVPDGFYNGVVAKRDDLSVARKMGANVIQTSLDRVLIPTEGTSQTKFAITAEEGAVSEEEPTLGQAALTIYHATKLVKASVQLVADEKANLLPFLTDSFARAEAAFENYYFVSTGTGSSQPQSALAASGAGLTAAGTNAITAAEVVRLVYSLDNYLDPSSCGFAMLASTLGYLRALTGNPFSFQATPAGDRAGESIEGFPVGWDGTMPAMTTGLKPIVFGNWSFYWIGERQGMSIQRLDELYAGNGQIGFLASFRRGGVVTQAEAFKHLLLA